ncbi:MAG: universal stress protein [Proteobacteria bacterium]|nr:universal stress protein [Pseudomonadota bacterium]
MKRFQNILVYPVNIIRSDPAIATATDIAQRTGANITLVSIETLQARTPAQVLACHQWHRECRASSADLLRELRASGVSADAVVLEGSDPAQLIIDTVRSRRMDLVIKTARSSDIPRNRFYSTVATELLQRGECPIWIVRATEHARPSRILAALGPLGSFYEQKRIDRDVVDVAAQLAETRQGELHLVSAWYAAVTSQRHIGMAEYQAYLQDCEFDAWSTLRRFLVDYPVDIPWSNVHLRRGHGDEVIARVADEIDADVVVVGSSGRTGLRRWILGNTVEQVMRRTSRAMVGVRAVAPQ